jgi:hypothetical protein
LRDYGITVTLRNSHWCLVQPLVRGLAVNGRGIGSRPLNIM